MAKNDRVDVECPYCRYVNKSVLVGTSPICGGEDCGKRVYCLPSDIRRVEEAVNHPAHYGGDTVYECIKVIEAWGLGFTLGNAVKYISRADRKGRRLEDLRKAAWYIQREIQNEERKESERR